MRVPHLDHFTHTVRDAADYDRRHSLPADDPREPDRDERHAPAPPPHRGTPPVSLEEWLLRCQAQAVR